MGIDISQFRDTYLEECFEGLQVMEQGLLELGEGDPDAESVNTIFRAAHSIKGGAGTYGFEDVGRLTHVVETLLDEYRRCELAVEQDAIAALLAAVDCLREMLAVSADEELVLPEGFEGIMQCLGAFLDADDAVDGLVDEPGGTGATRAAEGWRIRFSPQPELFKTGNDPLRLIRCLQELGDVSTEVSSALPPWDQFDPECCYSSWNLVVRGEASRESVEEVFDWVLDLADVEIDPLESLEGREVGAASADAVKELTPVEAKAIPSPAVASPTARRGNPESGSIRVNIDKVDALINMVGELVITQSMLSQIGDDLDVAGGDRLRDGLVQLERNARELQESVMRIRMVPMSFAFGRMPRVVHDVAARLGKLVELDVAGEQTELDKTVMERIHDPLVHIVRNSLDHGLESPAERAARGKPEAGRIALNAYHHGGNIVIEVSDDGAGLDLDRIQAKARERGLLQEGESLPEGKAAELIFAPGFSTAATVTDVSGRGVGMDVVKRNIDALGGSIGVSSQPGVGTTMSIRLPLTLAILDGQTICVGSERYILPLNSIVETIQVKSEAVNVLAGGAEVFRLRDEYLRIIRLADLFGAENAAERISEGLLVVVEGGSEKVGLFVDELLAQQQIVIKSLETNYRKVDGVSGATILGDGRVALILDVAGLVRMAKSGPGELDRAGLAVEQLI